MGADCGQVGAIAIMESRRRNAKNSIITAGVLGV